MKQKITIGWLYPTLMNVYGDIGNVKTLQKRLEWRNIECFVKYLEPGFKANELNECDILLMGGAQDKQQEIVSKDLYSKRENLKNLIEKNVPGLYVCGAYQFLGNYYKKADGKIIEGLGIFDLYTENSGNTRLIGNIIANSKIFSYLIGFENHGGKTYLGKNIKPLAKVIKGFGNNGSDKTEGAIYKNSIGTYLHGPILPKNPKLADYLIQKALENIYTTNIELKKLDNFYEQKARLAIAKKLKVAI
ncbi:MAG: glutamine amidotransferase [Patescibacteria group bacterium]